MVFKILNADYTQVPEVYSQTLTSLINSLFQVEPEMRPTAKQVFNVVYELLQELSIIPLAKCNTVEDYDNDFDSLSDHSSTTNLEISHEMATLSIIPCQDTLETTNSPNCDAGYTSLNRDFPHLETCNETLLPLSSDHYSDDFNSFSENEDD